MPLYNRIVTMYLDYAQELLADDAELKRYLEKKK